MLRQLANIARAVSPTRLVDALASVVSPRWALRRSLARQALEYHASTAEGRRGRTNPNPRPPRGFPSDRAMRGAGRITERQYDRDDARQLVATNPIAAAAIRRWRTYVAGVGTPGVRSTCTDKAWADRATALISDRLASPGFELGGRTFGQTLREFVKAGKIDGDCALLLPDAGTHAGRVQLLTADRIWSPARMATADGGVVVDGVEYGPEGEVRRYHVRNVELLADTRPVPAEAVLFHRFETLHPDDARGTPFAFATHDKFVDADTLLTSITRSANLAARIALVVTQENPVYPTGKDGEPAEEEVDDQTIVRLRSGEDIKPIQGASPRSDVNAFLLHICRVIAAAEGMPVELLLLHFSDGSFSSVNAAFTIFAAAVQEAQDDLIAGVLEPLYRWLIRWEIAAGNLDERPDQFAHAWTLRPPSALFPEDQAKADAVLRDLGLKTFQEQCKERGLDWRRQLADLAESEEVARALKVFLAHSTATRAADALVQPAPGKPAAPAA